MLSIKLSCIFAILTSYDLVYSAVAARPQAHQIIWSTLFFDTVYKTAIWEYK